MRKKTSTTKCVHVGGARLYVAVQNIHLDVIKTALLMMKHLSSFDLKYSSCMAPPNIWSKCYQPCSALLKAFTSQ